MKPSIAIAGSTGHLGSHITAAVLASSSSFQRILLLTRNTLVEDSSLASAARKYSNVSIATISESDGTIIPANLLEDIDVLVSALPSSAQDLRQALARALAQPECSVKLYFPSEFGVDHYGHDFEFAEWSKKRAHAALLRDSVAPGRDLKVCKVFCGLFLEDSIGPWFGFHTSRGRYEAVGSADALLSLTAFEDVGRAVVSLALREPGSIPETLHLAGDTVSMRQIATFMTQAGGGEIEVDTVDLDIYREKTPKESGEDPAKILRFLMGEGSINHSTEKGGRGNDNEVVSRGSQTWTWKTIRDLAEETKGRPWVDSEGS